MGPNIPIVAISDHRLTCTKLWLTMSGVGCIASAFGDGSSGRDSVNAWQHTRGSPLTPTGPSNRAAPAEARQQLSDAAKLSKLLDPLRTLGTEESSYTMDRSNCMHWTLRFVVAASTGHLSVPIAVGLLLMGR